MTGGRICMKAASASKKKGVLKKTRNSRTIWNYHIMVLIGMVWLFFFNIVPMFGIVIAFEDYNPMSGLWHSDFVGMENFAYLFSMSDCKRVIINTLGIAVAKLILNIIVPLAFALLLNEIRQVKFKKAVQTIVYLPHFLSWVVIYGVFVSFLGSTGVINSVITSLGFEPVSFLMDSGKFRGILVIADAWKEIGWSSIIYFAAIAGLDQECFEAADVDGATRMQKIWYITLPSLLPTIVLMLIIRVGNIMNAGFDQIFVFYNPTVYDVADIIGTYVYRMGLGKLEFSTGTAVGLFNSVISMILVLSSNFNARKATGKGIW